MAWDGETPKKNQNETNHSFPLTQDEKDGVGDVEPLRESAHEDEDEGVKGNEIDDEDVAAPRRHHVEIGQCRERCPLQLARLHRC